MLNKIFEMFEKKTLKEKSIWYHPGIYKFYFPYISSTLIPNAHNYQSVYQCEVEMHVGMEHDMEEGTLATIIIKADIEGIGVTNFIEDIASKIRLSFFDKVFHDEILEDKENQLEGRIRWLEYYSPAYYPSALPDGSLREVIMNWNTEAKRYEKPDWINYEGRYSKHLAPKNRKINQGEVYLAEIYRGNYPILGNLETVLILHANELSEEVIVAPITTQRYKELKFHKEPIYIGENSLDIDKYAAILVEKIIVLHKEYLGERIGEIDEKKLNEALKEFKGMGERVKQY